MYNDKYSDNKFIILNDNEIEEGFINIFSSLCYTLIKYTDIYQFFLVKNYKSIVNSIVKSQKKKNFNIEVYNLLHSSLQGDYATDECLLRLSKRLGKNCRMFITPLFTIDILPYLNNNDIFYLKKHLKPNYNINQLKEILFLKDVFLSFRKKVLDNIYVRYSELFKDSDNNSYLQEYLLFVAFHLPKFNARYANSFKYVMNLVTQAKAIDFTKNKEPLLLNTSNYELTENVEELYDLDKNLYYKMITDNEDIDTDNVFSKMNNLGLLTEEKIVNNNINVKTSSYIDDNDILLNSIILNTLIEDSSINKQIKLWILSILDTKLFLTKDELKNWYMYHSSIP